jgi:hypothetical protein
MGRSEDLQGIVEKPITAYESVFSCTVSAELAILDECFCRVDRCIANDFPSSEAPEGYDLSQFKVAGVICYWLRKLKPFSTEDVASHLFVNEIIAFLVGYYLVYGYQVRHARGRCPKITSNYLDDLVKSYRYNAHSPHSSAFIFESLCMGRE